MIEPMVCIQNYWVNAVGQTSELTVLKQNIKLYGH